jgi:hypothetical protein
MRGVAAITDTMMYNTRFVRLSFLVWMSLVDRDRDRLLMGS